MLPTLLTYMPVRVLRCCRDAGAALAVGGQQHHAARDGSDHSAAIRFFGDENEIAGAVSRLQRATVRRECAGRGHRRVLVSGDFRELSAGGVHALAAGGAYLSPTIARWVIGQVRDDLTGLEQLASKAGRETACERLVLRLLGEGHSKGQSAATDRRGGHSQSPRESDPGLAPRSQPRPGSSRRTP